MMIPQSIARQPSPSMSLISLICGVLWPLSLGAQVVVGTFNAHMLPSLVAVPTALCLLLSPPLGIVTGHIGLYQGRKQQGKRWLDRGGLIFNYMWLLALCLASNSGAVLLLNLQKWLSL